MSHRHSEIFAHRGSSARCPENTMAAFYGAQADGADGIELDVQLTGDGQVAVIHDHVLDRTTTGTGLVRSHTMDEIRQYSAGSWFSPAFSEERVPSLLEVLEWISSTPLKLNIELKCPAWDRQELAEAVEQLVRKCGVSKKVIYSSFDHLALKVLERLSPDTERAALIGGTIIDAEKYAVQNHFSGLHVYYPMIDEQTAEAIIGRGLALRLYTVNDPDWLAYFLKQGVTAVMTDDPRSAVDIRKGK
ncbi:glycerophosphodiester phosphodiesterase family protein [Alteribacter natronophilus]|uniref:glycerophosphodiester phosphodiesterase family protein n=1 Tax=Alteribacter natronophilus TaxID=2583810 RepID=UPI00110F439C|nr:glycerophosphodiester phosphodiesterase family protein [Alteribacter natronophilus]TMW70161.1 glycerophosphodiester phosphodiesterase [Alteribacter natronophilus]